MNETRLTVEACLAFAWDPAEAGEAPPLDARGNMLLMRAVNALEGMATEYDADKPYERLETKLDLALHWLAQVLHGAAKPSARTLRLDAEGIAWRTNQVIPAGSRLRLKLYPSARLGAPLELAARQVTSPPGWLRAELCDLDEGFIEQWEQWLFRLHRRGIQAARGRPI